MALYDRADLVARFRRLVKRPTNDASISTTEIYRYLSDGQQRVMRDLAVHVPAANRPVKEKMETDDGGLTYTIDKEPIGNVDVYPNKRAPYPLTPGEAWNHAADFEWEGLQTIRMVGDQTRDFPNGPYAHYVPVPDDIDAETEPTVVPRFVRILIPYAAAAVYVSEGGFGDPTFYDSLYQKEWSGDPAKPGQIGILGELRLRYGTHRQPSVPWWRSPDLSDLPIGTNS